jgi:hypothetical protein
VRERLKGIAGFRATEWKHSLPRLNSHKEHHMKNTTISGHGIRRSVLIASITALVFPLVAARPQAGHDDHVTPPRVPAKLEVPRGNEAVLVGHAEGTQNYSCTRSVSGVAWVLFTPQATLFTDRARQLMTHFFSPNRVEGDVVRAAWQDSRDTSTVWGRVSESSSDAAFVRPGAIPWLLIEQAGVQEGPTRGDRMTKTTFIQRVNTVGGAAPSTGCALPTDVGKQAFVAYTADYFFYEDADRHGRNDR